MVAFQDKEQRQRLEAVARVVSVRKGQYVYVCVTDWTTDEPTHHIGRAGGGGYDKFAAASDGAVFCGVTVGDHCEQNPTLESLADLLQYGDPSGGAAPQAIAAVRKRYELTSDNVAFSFRW